MNTTHDIERDGKRYIMEWRTDEHDINYIAITEACDDDPDDDDYQENCEHETYDFLETEDGRTPKEE